MQANTLTLKDIFRKDIRYVVPMFQRPYVWNEEEHWQYLWDDLTEVVDELLEKRSAASEGERDRRTPEQETPPHFLGAMVLDQVSTPTRKLETREIIDGQQRLTTLQIFLGASRDLALDLDLPQQASLLGKLIYNDEDLIEDDGERLKIWPIRPDQEAFRFVMSPDGNKANFETGSDSSGRIFDSYLFFKENLLKWLQEGEESIGERMDALTSTLWSLLQIVVIDLEDQDDQQVIFETLNARGTPLLAADLIKNYVFREARRGNLRAEPLHAEYWQHFDDEEWREEVRQGRLRRPRIDVFVMHWLTMRMAKIVRAEKLFMAFRRFLSQTDLSIEELLKDIQHHSRVYRRFEPPYPRSREGLFFRRLSVIDTTTPYPVLLWLYGNEKVDPADRRLASEAIESWLIRRMLTRLTTNAYNKLFLDLLQRLDEGDPQEAGRLVVEFFRERKGDTDVWPDDEMLRRAMVSEPYWNRINQSRLKMVFRALERELRSTGFSEELEISSKLHVEHLLPQNWAHHWPLPGEEHEEVERIRRDEIKDTIGNLTVLTEKLNPRISNREWELKREEIGKHSVLRLNKYLVERNPEWNEKTIRERAEWLAGLASRVWPGPDSEYWDE